MPNLKNSLAKGMAATFLQSTSIHAAYETFCTATSRKENEMTQTAALSAFPATVGVGICTHLGCSPSRVAAGSSNPSLSEDWKGGLFCPCQGSTFDLAGRVFLNKPAPANLEVPPHKYLADSKLLIGEDDLGAA